MNLPKFIQRFFNKLPKYKYDVWYNYNAHSKEGYPKIFDDKGKYIECKIGVKLIMGETSSGEKIYYEVVSYRWGRDGDYLYESDRIRCKMKFSHIESKKL